MKAVFVYFIRLDQAYYMGSLIQHGYWYVSEINIFKDNSVQAIMINYSHTQKNDLTAQEYRYGPLLDNIIKKHNFLSPPPPPTKKKKKEGTKLKKIIKNMLKMCFFPIHF